MVKQKIDVSVCGTASDSDNGNSSSGKYIDLDGPDDVSNTTDTAGTSSGESSIYVCSAIYRICFDI